jgi:uncharacterized membrane protein YgcG
LKDDFDSQIQRLVMKLSVEQQARAEVEQRIESVSVRAALLNAFGLIWQLNTSNLSFDYGVLPLQRQLSVTQSESADPNAGKSFFSKLFGGGGAPTSSGGQYYGSGGSSGRLSLLLPAMSSFAPK